MKKILISATAVILAMLLAAGSSFPAMAEGMAPIAENLDFTTCRNTSVGGNLSAYDSDGTELIFKLTTKPVKGDIVLETDGRFVYTPRPDKRGKDYFGYRVTDADGNSSQEATVIITIQKEKPGIKYDDMEGNAAEYAAVVLDKLGLYTGPCLCGRYCFEPEESVTRGEFLSICMELSGEKERYGVLRTGFSDDESIPVWLKETVTAAAIDGLVAPVSAESGTSFAAAEPVTRSDAAIMLSTALGLTSPTYNAESESREAIACAKLSSCGIITNETVPEGFLTRAEEAMLIAAAIERLG